VTEEDARAWLQERFPAHRITLLERFVALLIAESERQSLIARSTFDAVWGRHIVDSAQLLHHTLDVGAWLDVGSGGGLPGIVIAILRDAPIILCEPRRKRVDFLRHAIGELGLSNADVHAGNVQTITRSVAVATARAVSTIDTIFDWTRNAVSRETQFALQRGRNWQEDVALAQRAWHGTFHVEQSITDPSAAIVLAHDVRAR
jgi:16S rRNA (guanine527-N7)-methyltransferase